MLKGSPATTSLCIFLFIAHGTECISLFYKFWDSRGHSIGLTQILSVNVLSYNYRPQIRLREGNVFTGVCLFQSGVGVTSNASWDRSHGRVPPPPPDTAPPPDIRPRDLPWTSDLETPFPASDSWWWSLETCSNLFIWRASPAQHLVVATETEAHMISKRVVCILLECFLVKTCKWNVYFTLCISRFRSWHKSRWRRRKTKAYHSSIRITKYSGW